MAGYDDPRAHALRDEYHAVFGGDELPVPVESIAEDLLALAVVVRDDLDVSGMLLPHERRIYVGPTSRSRAAASRSRTSSATGSASAWKARSSRSTAALRRSASTRRRRRSSGRRTSSPRTCSCPSRPSAPPRGENRFGVSDEALAWRLYNLGLRETRPT